MSRATPCDAEWQAQRHDSLEGIFTSVDNTLSMGDREKEKSANDGTIPSDLELRQLRRVPGKVPRTTYLIGVLEMVEKFSFSGTLVVFTNFLQQPLPHNSETGAGGETGQSGALGYGQRITTAVNLACGSWIAVSPLFGAIVAEQYLGRYKTLQWSCMIAIIGHMILISSAIPPVIDERIAALTIFMFGMFLTGVGFGGIEANVVPLVVESIPDISLVVVTNKKNERVIVDPEATRSRAILYFYSLTNAASIVGGLSMVYAEKLVGFWLAYTIPTVMFLFCPWMLYLIRSKCPDSLPTPSVILNALRVCFLSLKGQISWNPARTYRNIRRPDFWTRAKPSHTADRPGWMTFEDAWVDELSRAVRACQSFIWFPLFWPSMRQLGTNMVSQAATMELHHLPNDILTNLNPVFFLILVPICTHIIYPSLERVGIACTAPRRISAGFMCGAAGMAAVAVVQHYVYRVSACGHFAGRFPADKHGPRLSVFAQIPTWLLLAGSEVTAITSGLEYACSQAPSNMRSFVVAVFYSMGALGNVVSQLLVPLSTDSFLVWNYGVIAILCAVAGVGVLFFNRSEEKTDNKKNEQNTEVVTAVQATV